MHQFSRDDRRCPVIIRGGYIIYSVIMITYTPYFEWIRMMLTYILCLHCMCHSYDGLLKYSVNYLCTIIWETEFYCYIEVNRMGNILFIQAYGKDINFNQGIDAYTALRRESCVCVVCVYVVLVKLCI